MKQEGKSIGYGIKVPPKPSEYDVNDPFYGNIKIKKNNFTGYVDSAKSNKTATVVIDRQIFVKKYSRYLKKRTRIQVHNPTSISAKEGDIVRVFETRPLSKTKHHVIVEIVGEHVDVKGQDLAKEEKDQAKKVKKENKEVSKDSKQES